MPSVVRALVRSRWQLVLLAATVLALGAALWVLAGDQPAGLAVVLVLQAATMLGFVVASVQATQVHKYFKATEKAVTALRTEVESGLAENREGLAAVRDAVGAQRLDAELRHDDVLHLPDELAHHVEKRADETIAEVAALHNLVALLPPREVMPPLGGYAATPQTLLRLASLAFDLPANGLIVECGCGASTVWSAYACKQSGHGRVIALEHDEHFAAATTEALQRNGLTDVAEVRLAPLEQIEIDGTTYPWYAPAAWADVSGIDLLFVDGPPGTTGKSARFPAFPLLAAALNDGAVVALDDVTRDDETEIAEAWVADHGLPVRLTDLGTTGRTKFLRASRAS